MDLCYADKQGAASAAAVNVTSTAHELHRSARVTFGLNEDVQNLAFGIVGTPQVHLLAADPDKDLVEVPLAMRLRPLGSDLTGDRGAEGHIFALLISL